MLIFTSYEHIEGKIVTYKTASLSQPYLEREKRQRVKSENRVAIMAMRGGVKLNPYLMQEGKN